MKTLFPTVEHRDCVKHIYNNFKVNHKGMELRSDNLSLSVREEKIVVLSKKNQIVEFILVAEFCTKRDLNLEAVAHTFRPLWPPKVTSISPMLEITFCYSNLSKK